MVEHARPWLPDESREFLRDIDCGATEIADCFVVLGEGLQVLHQARYGAVLLGG